MNSVLYFSNWATRSFGMATPDLDSLALNSCDLNSPIPIHYPALFVS